MNTYYGGPKRRPFDLAHRRWPVRYKLAPDADPAERTQVRDELAAELASILKKYLDANRSAPEPFLPTPTTLSQAAY